MNSKESEEESEAESNVNHHDHYHHHHHHHLHQPDSKLTYKAELNLGNLDSEPRLNQDSEASVRYKAELNLTPEEESKETIEKLDSSSDLNSESNLIYKTELSPTFDDEPHPKYKAEINLPSEPRSKPVFKAELSLSSDTEPYSLHKAELNSSFDAEPHLYHTTELRPSFDNETHSFTTQLEPTFECDEYNPAQVCEPNLSHKAELSPHSDSASNHVQDGDANSGSNHDGEPIDMWKAVQPTVVIVNDPMYFVRLKRQTKSKFVNFFDLFKSFTQKWFSHILLIITLFLYGCIGAWIFMMIEGKAHARYKVLPLFFNSFIL